jgi:pyrroline-5-carboxylate reductase
MFAQTKIGFIGGGKMAEAIIGCIIKAGLVPPERILATDVLPARCQALRDQYGIAASTDNADAVSWGQVLVLAVKPQVLPLVVPGITGTLPKGQLVMSIVTGATLETLAQGLGRDQIVRIMPNTPAQVGAAMSAWIATPAVTDKQRGQAQEILRAMGEELEVRGEHYIDMATAINGSGPAYFFLILEAMVDAAVQMGFARSDAVKLVTQTALGSVLYAKSSDLHLAELKNAVTTPGGTTADALYTMEKAGLRTMLADGIQAAYDKARLLAKMSKGED